jgi:Uma2 family endonuclease
MSQIEAANSLTHRLPGVLVEIIGGQMLATPRPDIAHTRVLKKVTHAFEATGLDDDGTEVHRSIGVWLPDEPEDYAIPDLCIVEADVDDHLVENNCYAPGVFRLVLEVTSSNWPADLRTKVTAYAQARVPVYVIVDRQHQRLHVLTDPAEGTYASHRVHAPGELVTLPDTLGAKVTLDVAEILKAGQPKGD